mgnify:CR=1 FL=1
MWGCDKDRRCLGKQKILPQIGILRYHSPRNNKDFCPGEELFIVTTELKDYNYYESLFLYAFTEPLKFLNLFTRKGTIVEGNMNSQCYVNLSIETENALFYGRGTFQKPRGRGRLKFAAFA